MGRDTAQGDGSLRVPVGTTFPRGCSRGAAPWLREGACVPDVPHQTHHLFPLDRVPGQPLSEAGAKMQAWTASAPAWVSCRVGSARGRRVNQGVMVWPCHPGSGKGTQVLPPPALRP